MWSVWKVLCCIFWLSVIPFCLGTGLDRKEQEKGSLVRFILEGYFIMFAIFEVLCVPATFLKLSFSSLCMVYAGSVMVCAVVSVARTGKKMWNCLKDVVKSIPEIPLLAYVSVILIAIQIGAYIVGMATDADDAMYVATATTTLHTDGIFSHSCYSGRSLSFFSKRYVLSPFPIFLAFLSKMTGFHPTVMAHTVLPVFFVLACYVVYHLWAKKLFESNRKEESIFLIFVSLVHMFSYYTVYTQGTFMLIRIWQGKAVLAAMLLPALFYYGWIYFEAKEIGIWEWLRLFCLQTSCCLVSSMGIMLAPIMLGILALVCALPKWKWKRIGAAFFSCFVNMILALMYLVAL